MERLTYEKSRSRWGEGRCPTKYTSRHTFQEVVARLAAYEDTGLEPEEVTAIKNAIMGQEIAKITEFCGVTIRRMQELAQAEKDGRLVAPEKEESRREKPVIRDDGIIFKSVKDAAESVWVSGNKVSAVCKGSRKTAGGHSFRYATREEAEAALKKRKEADNGKN